jgi:hypothetical protein
MSNVLGILELIAWIISVIAIAAGVTYAVVRFAPRRDKSASGPATTTDGSI